MFDYRISEHSYSYSLLHLLCIILTGTEVSNQQYTLKCSRSLVFEKDSSVVCHNYKIIQDNECELRESATHFVIRLSLTFTDRVHIDQQLSHARVTIDDSQEPECCESMCGLV